MSPLHPIVVTGAGRAGQVGEAVARELAARGHPLLLVDRDADAARERAEDLQARGHEAASFVADLSDGAAVAALAAQLGARSGGALAGLVHVAGGFAMGGTVAEADDALWDRMLAINLTTARLATRALLPLLRPARGALVYFASVAALPGMHGAGMAAYAAAKAGVVALMRAVAEEERATGVRANAVAPSAIRTAANVAAMGDGKYVEREEVARVVAWLAGEESRPLTGEVVRLG